MLEKKVKDFEIRENRKPKVYIVKLGQDGHDRGQKVVGSALADIGFDVNVGPLFQTPSEAAEEAIKFRCRYNCCLFFSGWTSYISSKIKKQLDNRGHDEIHIIVGGVIPKEDFSTLIDDGASAIFATGTNIVNSAMEMLQIIESSNSGVNLIRPSWATEAIKLPFKSKIEPLLKPLAPDAEGLSW